MPEGPALPTPRPDGAVTAAEVYDHLADTLRWASMRMLDLEEEVAAESLADAAVRARRHHLAYAGEFPGAR